MLNFAVEMKDLVKQSGQVYTPDYLVGCILDEAGYFGPAVLGKHCMENSCGSGAFLCEIVRRYCSAYEVKVGSLNGVEKELAKFIHGIELDKEAYGCCLENLDALAKELGLGNVKFDITNEDTLGVTRYDGKMDFVVGNPPYVRVHNLNEHFAAVKSFNFASGGMTDLYLVFFEIGLRMLRDGGKLCYITPSSWINSLAGQNMRQYIMLYRNLMSVIDLEHFQPFKATTYTMISHFEKGRKNDSFEYNVFDPETFSKRFVDNLPFGKVYINGCFYLADRSTLAFLREIITSAVPKRVVVKNGFATLADKVFIADSFTFDKFVIPVIKASTGKWYKALYPYDSEGSPLSEGQVFSVPEIRKYLFAHKDDLLKGAKE